MKTTIKTKDLFLLLDISNEGFFYKNQNIKLDFDLLEKYILNPKGYKVFEQSSNIEDSLYKNLALYIINSNDNVKFIQIDIKAMCNLRLEMQVLKMV